MEIFITDKLIILLQFLKNSHGFSSRNLKVVIGIKQLRCIKKE